MDLKGFTCWLQARQLSPSTVKSYLSDLKYFLNVNITSESVHDYLMLISQNKKNSVCRKLVALKHLFTFTSELLPLPKVSQERSPLVTVAREEVFLMLQTENLKTQDSWRRIRNAYLLECLFGSGLRISEACALETQHVSGKWIQVLGKNQRFRSIPQTPIGQVLFSELNPQNKYIFTRKDGHPLAIRSCFKIIKSLVLRSQVDPGLSPHSLRRGFASELLNNGAPLRHIQLLLGHCSLDTTSLYCLPEQALIQEQFLRQHPLIKLAKRSR